MTLVLWKSPVVYEAEDAERLLKSFYETDDESAFDPSADVAAVSAELLRRFPDTEDGPWADGPPYPTDRVLLLSIRWGADDAVLDAITELARRHELILYDPQGPDVVQPTDPVDSGPTPPPTRRDLFTFVLMGVAAAVVFWIGWRIRVPVLDWVLMIAGGFAFSVIVFLIYMVYFDPKAKKR